MAYGLGGNYDYNDSGIGQSSYANASGPGMQAASAAPAAGPSGGGMWQGAAIMGGASALSGMMQAMYQQELERQKRMQEAAQTQISVAGQNGQNQQQMLAQMLGGYKTALGV
jgi:hypothetical protein